MTRRQTPQPDTEGDTPLSTPNVTLAEPVTDGPVDERVAADLLAPDEPSSDAGANAVISPEGEPGKTTSTAPPEPPPTVRRSAGALGPIFGGALAAVAGFAVSHFNLLSLTTPADTSGLAVLSARVDELAAKQAAALDQITGETSGLGTRLTNLEAAPVPDPPDLSRLDAIEERLAAIEAMPQDGNAGSPALAAKVAELERRLASLPAADGSAELQARLDEAMARLQSAEAAARAKAAEAEAAMAATVRSQALAALAAAVADGRPLAADLQALADPDLTAALTPYADSGVPTLGRLQTDFPDAARLALKTARDVSGSDTWSDRLVDYLASQTGARPLTPLDGPGPDAVLSRAEFALSEGRVGDALTELAALDPVAQAPLQSWITGANAYVAAAKAVQAAKGE